MHDPGAGAFCQGRRRSAFGCPLGAFASAPALLLRKRIIQKRTKPYTILRLANCARCKIELATTERTEGTEEKVESALLREG